MVVLRTYLNSGVNNDVETLVSEMELSQVSFSRQVVGTLATIFSWRHAAEDPERRQALGKKHWTPRCIPRNEMLSPSPSPAWVIWTTLRCK